jgi:hypothetical protein
MKVKDAVKLLVNSYGNAREQAKSCQVDPKEIQKELLTAIPDTAEYLVLTYLAEAYPI